MGMYFNDCTNLSSLFVPATAACEGMKPYFQEIIGHFRGYLVSATEEDTKKLQVAAIGKHGIGCRFIVRCTGLSPIYAALVSFGVRLAWLQNLFEYTMVSVCALL